MRIHLSLRVTPAMETNKKSEPRKITLEQQEEMINYLSIYPKGKISITAAINNDESYSFAQQIESVFLKAGYTSIGIDSISYKGIPKGVGLIIHSKKTAPFFTSIVQKAFNLIGIEALAEEDSTIKPNELEISVYYKPQMSKNNNF